MDVATLTAPLTAALPAWLLAPSVDAWTASTCAGVATGAAHPLWVRREVRSGYARRQSNAPGALAFGARRLVRTATIAAGLVAPVAWGPAAVVTALVVHLVTRAVTTAWIVRRWPR